MSTNIKPATALLLSCIAQNACTQQHNKNIEPTEHPNIIFILADDLGWSDLGCYGNTFNETPEINQLAADGMRFTHAYAACPVSSPTRASILTGKYTCRTGITDWIPGRQKDGTNPGEILLSPVIKNNLDLNEVTIAEKLKPFGYTTALIGKWHLGDSLNSPAQQGFDVVLGGRGSAKKYFYPEWTETFNTRNISGKKGEYIIDRITDESMRFIRQNGKQPFFLYLGLYSVHIPLEAPDSLIRKYEAKKNSYGDSCLANPVYAAMLENTDKNIGRLMSLLDSMKLTKNTIVIFTSDNGGLASFEGPHTPATNNYPLRNGKGYLYEGGVRIPMLVRWPQQIKAGTTTDAVTISPDHFATLCNISGADYSNTDGISYLPLLQGRQGYNRGAIYWHYPHYSNQGGKPASAVLYNNHKLIRFHEDQQVELYNIKEDMSEKNDLAALMPAMVQQLSEMLDKWMISVNAQLPVPIKK